MTGDGRGCRTGGASLAMGGAFEVPWADRICGAYHAAAGKTRCDWHGTRLSLPGRGQRRDWPKSGLMLMQRGEPCNVGQRCLTAARRRRIYHAGDFGGHWLSKTDVTISVLLSSRTIELTVVATQCRAMLAEPVGIGWRPRFAILGGDRAPDDVARCRGRCGWRCGTGPRVCRRESWFRLGARRTTSQWRKGAKLGQRIWTTAFVSLQQNLLDNGPVAELSRSCERLWTADDSAELDHQGDASGCARRKRLHLD